MKKLTLFCMSAALAALCISSFFYKNLSISAPSSANKVINKRHIHSGYCMVPAYPDAITIEQPDGNTFLAYNKGNQVVNYLRTADGYTVLKDQDGFYKYAVLDDDDRLVPSGVVVHEVDLRSSLEQAFLAPLPQELSWSEEVIALKEKKHLENMEIARGPNPSGPQGVFPSTGTRDALMLLIDYPDQPFQHTNTEIDNMMNQIGYSVNGASGSFKEFYQDVSHGELDINTTVSGWYRAANNRAFYSDNARALIREAVDAAEATGLDFSIYDGDGDGSVDVVMAIHSGRGEEESGDPDDIWSHRWVLGPQAITYDGVFISDYIIQPERYGPNNIANIGVVSHEFGHAMGLPDLYDTNGGSEGAGRWCLMAGGTWNNSGRTPAHPNAWCKEELGWGTPTTLSNPTDIVDMNQYDDDGTFYRINMPGVNEYLLISNRQQTGWDTHLPGSGLAIWHIDEDRINATRNSNTVNSEPTHYGTQLEQADNNNGLNNGTNRGDSGDLYPGNSNNTNFNCVSSPSSATHNNNFSNISITQIEINNNLASFSFNECQPSLISCTNAINITPASGCGGSIFTGHTDDGTNLVTTYSCSSDDYSGNEMVFEIILNNDQDITATLSGTTADLDLFLLNNCTEHICNLTGDLDISTNLTAGTYYLVVDGKNGVNSPFTLSLSAPHCSSGGETTEDEWIGTVEVGDITNASGDNDGYMDFTDIVIPLHAGRTTPFTLTPEYSNTHYQEYWRIWIDLDCNGSFDDPGEMVFDPGTTSNEAVTGQFTLPCNTNPGEYTMRISMRYNTANGSCGSFTYGEVEDYTVDIQAFTPPDLVIPEAQDATITADNFCTDSDGWMHFTYFDNSNNTEYLLLSVLPDPMENQLNIEPADVIIHTGNSATESLDGDAAPDDYITNPDGWSVINRYWDINLDPSEQPTLPVQVRTYFTTTEYNDLAAASMANGYPINSPSEMIFYKVNSSDNPWDHYAISDTEIIFYESGSASNNWALSNYGSDYAATFTVSSFSGGGGGSGEPIFVPLPVELTEFTAIKSGKHADLNWITASEINADRFEIEHSANGIDFEYIGEKTATNQSTGSRYHFVDLTPTYGINYYRLKMIDQDQTFEYSEIRAVQFRPKNDIRIYPNPARDTDDIFIEITTAEAETLAATVMNISGKQITSFDFSTTPGNNLIPVNQLANQPAGVYFIRLKKQDGTVKEILKWMRF